LRLKFLGACQQVTGSCYFLQGGGLNLLIDCGIYQERNFVERNWRKFPVSPGNIDFVILTHAHLDHSGLLPKLVREGFSRSILTTSASKDIIPIILMDSARIQEEDAAYKKKRHKREGYKAKYPEIPLYTVRDAERVLPLLKEVSYEESLFLNDHVSLRFRDAGHILGSAMLEINVNENCKEQKIVFSGDIGQWNKPLMKDPSSFDQADYVIMESTYGDRDHEDKESVEKLLCKYINETLRAGGNVVIPTFAIERAQELMFYLNILVRQDRIPYLMVFLDSPMAENITEVFLRHKESLDRETLDFIEKGKQPFDFPGLKFVRTTAESKEINNIKGSCIIMAGSGMCTGGRIKYHLIQNISRPESMVLFVGYQAGGTLGRQIIDGNREVRIHGRNYPVRARIEQIQGFSAHADRTGLYKWLSYFKSPPKKIFLTHGEKRATMSLSRDLQKKKGWNVKVPEYMEEWELN